jgi:hypothetical protein
VAERIPRAVEQVVEQGHELRVMECPIRHSRRSTAMRRDGSRSAAILRVLECDVVSRPCGSRTHTRLLGRPTSSDSSSAVQGRVLRPRTRESGGVRRDVVGIAASSMVRRAPARCQPVVLFVPARFVDLRREKLRLDCRFKTGDIALGCVRDVLESVRKPGRAVGCIA